MACKSISRFFAGLKSFYTSQHFLTSTTDHNGPQVSRTSDFRLNNKNNTLIDEAGLCAAPIQWTKKMTLKSNHVDLSSIKFHNHSEGKRKQNLAKNNLSTASFSFRFFIQLRSQMAHISCDFPLVYWKLH